MNSNYSFENAIDCYKNYCRHLCQTHHCLN